MLCVRACVEGGKAHLSVKDDDPIRAHAHVDAHRFMPTSQRSLLGLCGKWWSRLGVLEDTENVGLMSTITSTTLDCEKVEAVESNLTREQAAQVGHDCGFAHALLAQHADHRKVALICQELPPHTEVACMIRTSVSQ